MNRPNERSCRIMAKNRSEKSPCPSIFSIGAWISYNQLIVEIVCQRAAKKDQKDLPQKFWTLTPWNKYYRHQITIAAKLCETYDPRIILKALRDPKGRTIYSLGAPHLKGLLEKYASMPEITVEVEIRELEESLGLRKPMENTKSLRSKLDG